MFFWSLIYIFEGFSQDVRSNMNQENGKSLKPIQGLYQDWFLDYASYVILERAVPLVDDGFKPVQRRIMHALKEMDDGRFNKVANVIGQTMQYHPHGDASITDALVHMGQKDLLVDTQGNWGDVRTGDSAAAGRYIEARLSQFALDVVFNPKTTEWQLSYDGRKNEPVHLPVKFPLLLAQGADGIAVGLSTKVLPHNFNELIDASIKYLQGKKFKLLPDFATGGMMDAADYQDGKRGGKIRTRTHIEVLDKKTLLIKSLPYGITTQSLIDSILKANDKGKIKIKQITDNTAAEVEVEIQLAPGVDPDIAIDALYAFTDCESSISANTCVIIEDRPVFTTVTEVLQYNTECTKALLKRELEIKLAELAEQWHFSNLEKIFIEKRIYRDIEEETTWEGVISAIDNGLKPYKKRFKRKITEDDIVRLTEIKIKRISKYDTIRADEHIHSIETDIEEYENHLAHLVEFTISYYENIKKKYGKGRERRTEIIEFDDIEVKQVLIANTKLYVDRKEGFIGTSLKKNEMAFECSDLDDIIVFKNDATMMVTKVSDKTFVGKGIIDIEIFDKNDDRKTYNMIYADGDTGIAYAKRFNVTSITRDRDYLLSKSKKGSKVLYFSSNPNGEAETVSITLSPSSKARNKNFEFSFGDLSIKGRSSKGNIVTKYAIKKIKLTSKGVSTLENPELYYDPKFGKLNLDGNGKSLGEIAPSDQLIAFYSDGTYEVTNTDLTNKYDKNKILLLEAYHKDQVYSLIYWDANKKQNLAKRFQVETTTTNTAFSCIKEGNNNKLLYVSSSPDQRVEINTGKKSAPILEEYDLNEIEISSYKTVGTKLNEHKIVDVTNPQDNNPLA